MDSNRSSDTRIIGGEFAITPEVIEEALNIRECNKTDISAAIIGEDDVDNLFFFSCGRAALYAVLRTENMDCFLHVSVPDYLCESVVEALYDSGVSYSFYHIENNLYPDMDSLFSYLHQGEKFEVSQADDSKSVHPDSEYDRIKEAIILINYFGVLDLTQAITEIRNKDPKAIIILDDVQNFYGFGHDKDYDYAFTSLRKWFPIPDGGALLINRDADDKIYEDRISKLVSIYNSMNDDNLFVSYKLAGNTLKTFRQVIADSTYLELIEKGEELLDDSYKCRMSDISFKLFLTSVQKDISNIAAVRKENAKYLDIRLTEAGIKHIYDTSKVPLFVPVFVAPHNRDNIRKRMFDNNIFCPVHWKKFLNESRKIKTNILYEMELSLICDQRYDQKDMEKIIEILIDEVSD